MKLAVTDLCGAQRDTGIEVTGGRNIANGAGIYAAPVRLELVDDLHGADFRCAGDSASRESGDHRVDSVEAGPDFALYLRGDMHHMAVILDLVIRFHPHRPRFRYAADIVAAKVQQHQVLGAFLDVSHEIGRVRRVFFLCRAALARSGDRTDGDDVVPQADKNFRAGPDNGKFIKIEEEQEGRGVQPPKAAIEIDRRQVERDRETLREHHLENIAGPDVILGRIDHGQEIPLFHVRARVGKGRGAFTGLGRRHRGIKRVERCRNPVLCMAPRGLRFVPFGRSDLNNKGDAVLQPVENGDQGRADQHRIRRVDNGRIGVGNGLDMADHVIAEIAEQAGRHWRQVPGIGHGGFCHKRAKRVDRGAAVGRKFTAVCRIAIDFGNTAATPPDQVGRLSDHREPAPDLAALDRFQKEGVAAACGEPQIGRHGCLRVRDQLARDQLWRAAGKAFGKRGEGVVSGVVDHWVPISNCWTLPSWTRRSCVCESSPASVFRTS